MRSSSAVRTSARSWSRGARARTRACSLLSLKSRRDIFIKTWWLNKIIDALRTKTLDSTGDVALRKFFDRHLPDMREALTAWGRIPATTIRSIGEEAPQA